MQVNWQLSIVNVHSPPAPLPLRPGRGPHSFPRAQERQHANNGVAHPSARCQYQTLYCHAVLPQPIDHEVPWNRAGIHPVQIMSAMELVDVVEFELHARRRLRMEFVKRDLECVAAILREEVALEGDRGV